MKFYLDYFEVRIFFLESIDSSNPMAAITAIRKLPPLLKNGNGIPIMGSKSSIIPKFMIMCKANIANIPLAIRLPKCDPARNEIIPLRNNNAPKISIRNRLP